MRSLLAALAVGLGLALAAQAAAQVQKCPGGASAGQPSAQWTQSEFRMEPGSSASAEGEVASVSHHLQVFSLREPGGQVSDIHVSPQTRITFPDGSLASLGDLLEGQRVRASYGRGPGGEAIAQRIEIIGGPGAEELGRGGERVPEAAPPEEAPPRGWKAR